MKIIILTKNEFAIVDDWNYDRLIKYKWHCVIDTKGYKYAQTRMGTPKK